MQNKQAGGIVSFIIVLVALAGLLASGLYLSKQQGRTARDNDTSTPQVATPDTNEEEAGRPEDEGTGANEGTPQQNPQGTAENRQEQPQSTPGATSPGTTAPRTDRVANTGPSAEIPSTGPTETVIVTLALGTLVFTSYRLVDSRRSLRRSALRR